MLVFFHQLQLHLETIQFANKNSACNNYAEKIVTTTRFSETNIDGINTVE
jgi:hypothetical protein